MFYKQYKILFPLFNISLLKENAISTSEFNIVKIESNI